MANIIIVIDNDYFPVKLGLTSLSVLWKGALTNYLNISS